MKVVLILLLLIPALAVFAQPQQKKEQIVVDGITREFVTYIPLTASKDKLPVIVALHGRLGTGENMMGFADFRSLAVRDKFIIVCPSGIDKSWNDGRPTPAQKQGINDVKFIDQLITYILKSCNGDPKKVYLTGMSNGGFMSSRLACELSNRFAAAAIVGASMDLGVDYHPVKAMPIMYIQGTKDPLVPYKGGVMKGAGGEIYGHEDVLKLWVAEDQCNDSPVITKIPDGANDGTDINEEEFTNAATSVKVVGYTVNGGGHTWPGGSQYLPRFLVGKVSHNMNACEVIWNFFKGYSLGN